MNRIPFGGLVVALGLLLNQQTFASAGCPSDINNNSQTDVNDLLAVLDGWGSCSGICIADISPLGGNGSVNVDDLLLVLDNWGNCPCSPANGCVQVNEVWCEDWELNNYSRWTGGYNHNPNPCANNNFNTANSLTPIRSHKSQIFCTQTDSHRGYGGLRFNGDNIVGSFSTPSPGGINAPNGVLVTFWSWLECPYSFSPTKWMSLLTVTHDCSNNWSQVVTLNLDDATRRLKPVHVSSVTYAPNAPAFPLNQWTRTTVYINYYTGSMHVWQDGTKVVSATFTRPTNTMCQWHFGLYASGNNDNITLYEENISIVKLNQPLTNFVTEPWFTSVGSDCNPVQEP